MTIINEKSEILYQYCRDKPALDDNNVIADFADNNTTDYYSYYKYYSFKIKEKITGRTDNYGSKT